MTWKRRDVLTSIGLGATATVMTHLTGCQEHGDRDRAAEAEPEPTSERSTAIASEPQTRPTSAQDASDQWSYVRAQFQLDPALVHLAGLLIASHPQPVQDAIVRYQQALNDNPAVYLETNNSRLESEVRQAAATYLGVRPQEVALTDSTTMGTALVINGLQIRSTQEMLTTDFDYYSTHESLRYKAQRTGAAMRKIPLYQTIQTVSDAEMVDRLLQAIRPQTRLVTATWVHSSTGLKVPIRQIADRLAEINADRDPDDRALLFVDGVHGLGVEATAIADLGCDFFAAGTHKWLFAPRGTGILWGRAANQAAVTPTIPTFTRGAGWGGRMTPGGFKPFEHLWAMQQAFVWHQQLGKTQVRDRIYSLSQQLKQGLAQMSHVTLYTPMAQTLSAGIICFDVQGLRPREVVRRLEQRQIIASDTPYSPSHARLTPGVYNTPEQMEQTLSAIRDLA
ncbi:aminotransferase class V-fold PLP-dependent enzyme [Pantanalinema rosaneae CENA516]|uniref:aminotransferase class V-fold PLP-dependent enzyme n=1 Tax=Pantanalinema rosaneae TaxID=1620701 RepID=UPI003D6E8C5E